MTHWHAGTGFTGYGPEPDGVVTAGAMSELPSIIFDELSREIDHLYDQFASLREHGEYHQACLTYDHLERLQAIRGSFDPDRAKAPVYINDLEAWCATVEALINEHFPLFVDPDSHRRMYVWDCLVLDCGMWQEEGS